MKTLLYGSYCHPFRFPIPCSYGSVLTTIFEVCMLTRLPSYWLNAIAEAVPQGSQSLCELKLDLVFIKGRKIHNLWRLVQYEAFNREV